MARFSSFVFCIRKYGAIVLDQLLQTDLVSVKGVVSKKDDFEFEPNCEEICAKYKVPIIFVNAWNESLIKDIKSAAVDIILCAWFHLKIPKDIFQSPLIGAVNFHPSLLPKYRGPSPVEWALVHGEQETGLSAHIIEEKFDSGPVISQIAVPIDHFDDADSLSIKLAKKGGALLKNVRNKITNNAIISTPQDANKATHFPLRTEKNAFIDPKEMTALEIYNKIRGFYPYPCCRLNISGKQIIAQRAEIMNDKYLPDFIPVDGVIKNKYCVVFTRDNKFVKITNFRFSD